MTAISTDDLVAQFPDLLVRLRAGEWFEVVDQGLPVARLVPAEAGCTATVAERQRALEELIASARAQADRILPGHVVDDCRESIYGLIGDQQT
jgi:antitoxin (DNA-binding transcriptional repressor) of toxin-antitoxin stability system